LIGPANAARKVASAASVATLYANVSGMSPSGAHPTHNAVTFSPV
jgi:hypothetical protein